MTRLRVSLALAFAMLAVLSALAARDIRSVRSALESGDAVYAATPSRASWTASTRLGGVAETLLGTQDEIRLREGLQRYAGAATLHLRLDNAVTVEGARARAQDALEAESRDHDPLRASRALTLLGILAFEASAAGGSQGQVDTAISDFTDAVRMDPTNGAAAYDLELLFRLSPTNGSRVGQGRGVGSGRTGHRGAGGGQPGNGY